MYETTLFHGISLDVCICQRLQHWSFGSSACCCCCCCRRLMLGCCFISPATARTCIDFASHSKRITSRLAAACFPLLFFYPIAFFSFNFKTASFSIPVFKVKFKLKFKHTPMCVRCFFLSFHSCSLFFSSSIARWNICSRKCLLDYLCASPNSIVLPLVSLFCARIMWENVMLMPFYFLFLMLDFFFDGSF